MNAIEIANLYFRYNKQTNYLFEDFSFAVKRGDKVGLIGGNGAGKSTLIKLILGIYQPLTGVVKINNAKKVWSDNLSSVGYVGDPGYNSVMLGLPVNSNVETIWNLYSRIYDFDGTEKDKQLELLEELAITKLFAKPIKFLSTGERKRVMLAMVFYRNPEIIIFDEPLDGLDRSVLPYVKSRLSSLSLDKDKTIIFISHNREEVDLYSEEVYELVEGDLLPIESKVYHCFLETPTKHYEFKNVGYSQILARLREELKENNGAINLRISTGH